MTSSTSGTDVGRDEVVAESGPVELHLPAQVSQLRLARLTASGFATELGFSLDEIEELRLAVDEACSLLVQHAPAGARLCVTYQFDGNAVVVGGRCPAVNGHVAPLDPIAETVLRTTVDDFHVVGDGEGTNTFRLVKRSARRT